MLIAGKGHEQGQDIAGVVRPFDDRPVLRAAIARSLGQESADDAPEDTPDLAHTHENNSQG